MSGIVPAEIIDMERVLSRVVLAVHRQLHPGTRLHGPDHWARVRAIGLELAAEIDVAPEIPIVFALMHDSCRCDDGVDRRHGMRAGQLFDRLVRHEHTELEALLEGIRPEWIELAPIVPAGMESLIAEARAALRSLPRESLRAVKKAIATHATADAANDPRVGLCMSADRLDRGRLHAGAQIRPELLPVKEARDPVRIARCLSRGRLRERPPVLAEVWGVG